MSSSITETAVPPCAPKAGTSGHGLFPHEPLAVKPAAGNPHLSLTEWIRQKVADLTPLGHRIFRADRLAKKQRDPRNPKHTADWVEGDPIADGHALGKALRHENDRKFDVDWLFAYGDEFGDEGRYAVLAFLSEVWGFVPPVKRPDEDAELAEIRRVLAERQTSDAVLEARLSKLIAAREVRR